MEHSPHEESRSLIDAEAYQAERLGTYTQEYSDAEHYDKWLLTLAAGTFGLSIAFMEKIAPHPIDESLWLIVGSWIALLLSMSCTLLSLLTAQSGWRKYRDNLDAMRVGEQQTDAQSYNWGAALTNFLNCASFFCFFVGAILLASFSFLNLPAEDSSDVGKSAATHFDHAR